MCLMATALLIKVYREHLAKDPVRVEREAIAAIRAQDWGTLYDLAPRQLWADEGLSREQIVTLFECVASKAPQGALKGMRTEPITGGAVNKEKGVDAVWIVFPEAPKRVDGLVAGDVIHAYRTRDGWRTDLGNLPTVIASWSSPEAKGGWATFAACMDRAGIRAYPVRSKRSIIDRVKLGEYLAGGREVGEIYSR